MFGVGFTLGLLVGACVRPSFSAIGSIFKGGGRQRRTECVTIFFFFFFFFVPFCPADSRPWTAVGQRTTRRRRSLYSAESSTAFGRRSPGAAGRPRRRRGPISASRRRSAPITSKSLRLDSPVHPPPSPIPPSFGCLPSRHDRLVKALHK